MKASRRTASELLTQWRRHCEEVHDATADDYGVDVVRWHKRTWTSCEYRGGTDE